MTDLSLHPRVCMSSRPKLAHSTGYIIARGLYRTRTSRRLQVPHRMHTVQLGNAAVNLTDHALRERPEVQVQRHLHYDVTQRAWIGFGDFDESPPERLARLRQAPHDLVYAVDAAKPLTHVAIWHVAAAVGGCRAWRRGGA